MTTKVKPIPEGYEGATPYLCCRGAAAALDFYVKAFGAHELMRMADPKGRIGHAEFKIGRTIFMLSDEHPEINVVSPETLGGTPVAIHLYVEDVDAFAAQAVATGATLERPVADQFYGDRNATLKDPFGHRWFVSTHIEDVPPDEMRRRQEAMAKE